MEGWEDIPQWCLYDALGKVMRRHDPQEFESIASKISSKNSALKPLCESHSLWRELYVERFHDFSIDVDKNRQDYNWKDRLRRRSSIAETMKSDKPRVKSFPVRVKRVRVLFNLLAFSTETEIYVIAYEYLSTGCVFHEQKPFVVPHCQDFVFLDETTILAATINESELWLINIKTPNRPNKFPISVDPESRIQPLGSGVFAIVGNTSFFVYKVGESCDKICERRFMINEQNTVLGTDNIGTTLLIATPNDVTAYNTSNPKAPILWSFVSSTPCSFFAVNRKAGYGLLGSIVVDLKRGALLLNTDVKEAVCGCVLDDRIAVIGCRRMSVVFYDYVRNEVVSSVQFGQGEEIRSITAGKNGTVAVAGAYKIRLYRITRGTPEMIRELSGGSISMRQNKELPMVAEVFFDGERCITNNEEFVRVYSFYNTKS